MHAGRDKPTQEKENATAFSFCLERLVTHRGVDEVLVTVVLLAPTHQTVTGRSGEPEGEGVAPELAAAWRKRLYRRGLTGDWLTPRSSAACPRLYCGEGLRRHAGSCRRVWHALSGTTPCGGLHHLCVGCGRRGCGRSRCRVLAVHERGMHGRRSGVLNARRRRRRGRWRRCRLRRDRRRAASQGCWASRNICQILCARGLRYLSLRGTAGNRAELGVDLCCVGDFRQQLLEPGQHNYAAAIT